MMKSKPTFPTMRAERSLGHAKPRGLEHDIGGDQRGRGVADARDQAEQTIEAHAQARPGYLKAVVQPVGETRYALQGDFLLGPELVRDALQPAEDVVAGTDVVAGHTPVSPSTGR